MSILIKSLYRLFNSTPKRVEKDKLKSMVEEGKITKDDYEYITGEKYGK